MEAECVCLTMLQECDVKSVDYSFGAQPTTRGKVTLP